MKTRQQRLTNMARGMFPGSLGGDVLNAEPFHDHDDDFEALIFGDEGDAGADGGSARWYEENLSSLVTGAQAKTLTYVPIEESLFLKLNGITLDPIDDYSVDWTAGIITFNVAADIQSTDTIVCRYQTKGDVTNVVQDTLGGLVLSDAFNGSAGTLQGRMPDVGAVWDVIDAAVGVDGSGAAGPTAWTPQRDNGVYAVAISDTGITDFDITIQAGAISGSSAIGVAFHSPDTNHWLFVRFRQNGSINLQRNWFTAGSYGTQDVHTFSDPGTINPDDLLRVVGIGSVVQVYVNGVSMGSYDMAPTWPGSGPQPLLPFYLASTKHGIGFQANITHDLTQRIKSINCWEPEYMLPPGIQAITYHVGTHEGTPALVSPVTFRVQVDPGVDPNAPLLDIRSYFRMADGSIITSNLYNNWTLVGTNLWETGDGGGYALSGPVDLDNPVRDFIMSGSGITYDRLPGTAY